MWMSVSVLVALACIALLAAMARRERTTVLKARGGLLDAFVPLFDTGIVRLGDDGFPGIEGRMGKKDIKVALIADSMAVRRARQLWLSVTLVEPLPISGAYGVLVRPDGSEFFAVTESFREKLPVPVRFPADVAVRGEGAAVPVLARTELQVGSLLIDTRVKEISVTPRGVRVIFQVGQGRRGNRLLLRQASFATTPLDAGLLIHLVDGLDDIRAAFPTGQNARALP